MMIDNDMAMTGILVGLVIAFRLGPLILINMALMIDLPSTLFFLKETMCKSKSGTESASAHTYKLLYSNSFLQSMLLL